MIDNKQNSAKMSCLRHDWTKASL